VGWLAAWLLASCAPNQATPPAAPAVTGSVTYRERSALPADAVVRVVLADVSRQDVAATPIAQATLASAGHQVPLPFALAYDPAAIDSTHTYAVRATIESGGRLIFTTTTANPVITRGHPTHLDLVLQAVSASAPAR
jgi:putative lipoprotein